MARPNPRAKSSKRGKHGDAISALDQPEIVTSGSGGGGGGGGPKKVKGPGVNASIKGKVKGM